MFKSITDKIENNVKELSEKCARYEDFKDLYNKVIPPMKVFEDRMKEMGDDYERSKEMIRRYDEIITEKASKTSID